MTASRDPDRLIRAFLAEGQTELSDQVYDAVRDRIEQTNQRVVIGPWRTPIMNNTVRLIAAAAAVVVVALIGYQLLIAPNVGGPPAPSATESPSPAPTVTSAPSEASGNVFPPAGPLEVGTRYSVTLFEPPNETAVVFTFAVPTDGWRSMGEGMFEGHFLSPQNIQLAFSNGDNHIPGVFPDPCVHEGLQAYEASVAGWADALTSIPSTEVVSGPTDVTVDGRAGQTAVIAIPQDVGCPREEFWLGFDASCPMTEPCYQFPTRLGETIHEWFVDVDGIVFSMQAQVLQPDQNPGAGAELQQIVDSIQFE